MDVPVAQRCAVGIELVELRRIRVEHDAAGPEQPPGLGDDPRHRLVRGLVQQDPGIDEIERGILKTGALGILLAEMHRDAQRLGAGVRVAQAGRGHIDAMHLGLRKRQLERQRVVADGAAHFQNAARLEIRKLLLEPVRNADAGIVIERALRAGAVDGHLPIEQGARQHIVSFALCLIAAGHPVEVERADVARNC